MKMSQESKNNDLQVSDDDNVPSNAEKSFSVVKMILYGFGGLVFIYFIIQFFKNLFRVTVKGLHSLADFIGNIISSLVDAAIALVHLPFDLIDSFMKFLFG